MSEAVAPPASSFVELDRMHVELDAHFQAHQEHLVLFDVPAATEALQRFAALLALHMEQEERHLLPLYAGVPSSAKRDQADVYRLEHRKLEQLIDNLHVALAGIDAKPTPAEVIHLLERGTLIKHVMEHHGARERALLYPALDSLAAPSQRDRIIRECLAQWAAANSP